MVYLASDKPLPLIDRNEDSPEFSITELSKYEKNVGTQFETPYVYNVGTHQGCGCGFLKEFKEEEDLALANENYLQLSTYLKKAQETGANLHIYSCWDGDQEAKPELREEINLKRMTEVNFEFKEKALYGIL